MAPSAEKLTHLTLLPWPRRKRGLPSASDHSPTVVSAAADASVSPAGENATCCTSPVWPRKRREEPAAQSHTRMSAPSPTATSLPSAEKATSHVDSAPSECIWSRL